MARANQSDRNLRNEVQSQLDDLSEDSGLAYDSEIYPEGETQIGAQPDTANETATRTKATPKTAAQQSASMRHKKGNQPPNR